MSNPFSPGNDPDDGLVDFNQTDDSDQGTVVQDTGEVERRIFNEAVQQLLVSTPGAEEEAVAREIAAICARHLGEPEFDAAAAALPSLRRLGAAQRANDFVEAARIVTEIRRSELADHPGFSEFLLTHAISNVGRNMRIFLQEAIDLSGTRPV